MPKSEALLQLEDVLAKYALSCHRKWWVSGGSELLMLLGLAEDQFRHNPANTNIWVWGDKGSVKWVLGPISADSPDAAGIIARQEKTLECLDDCLVRIAFGLLFDSLRAQFRKRYSRFCANKFGWKVTEETIDDHQSDVQRLLLECPSCELRYFIHPDNRAALFYQVFRGLSGLKRFWHLDRKVKVVSLTTRHSVEGPLETEFLTKEIWDLLDATTELNDEQKQLIRLKFKDEMTIRQIAAEVGFCVSWTSDLTTAATRKFQDVLLRAGYDPC